MIIFPFAFEFVTIHVFVCSLTISFSISYFTFVNLAVLKFYDSVPIKVVFTKLTFVLNLALFKIIPSINSLAILLRHM